jgi:hypothetical protein
LELSLGLVITEIRILERGYGRMDTDGYHKSYLLRMIDKKLEHNHFPDVIVDLTLTVATLRWLKGYLIKTGEKSNGQAKPNDG